MPLVMDGVVRRRTDRRSPTVGHGAELEWPMGTIWPWRDMDELSFLQYMDLVPFAFRHDARFACMQLNGCIRLGLSSDLEAARNYVEYLVPIRMDFASVR